MSKEDTNNKKSRSKIFLNDLGNLAIDTVKLLDPTGISSWGDAYKAIKNANTKNPESILNAAIETVGALPVVGKIGKIGKLSKLIRNTEKFIVKAGNVIRVPEKTTKTMVALSKVPGKIITYPVKFVPNGRNKVNNLRNAVKVAHVASSADDVLAGGLVKKVLAQDIAKSSAGEASILSPLGILIPGKYNGTTKANDTSLTPADKKDVIKQMLFGNQPFKPYTKPIYVNGQKQSNTYYAQLYPSNSITADKKLYGTTQQANSGNFFNSNIETPIIDSHKFRIKFNKNYARASDTYDFDTNTISGRMMMAAMKPTWLFPNAGAPVFVQEIPVKYENSSDQILKTALEK